MTASSLRYARFAVSVVSVTTGLPGLASASEDLSPPRPNIILVMTDDQGWAQTGYYGHPVLKTPHLDAMAANGLRFDRFYAGAPVCSPTRASVLTGRHSDRTGVVDHGYPLRLQEKTLPVALKDHGYRTGHFGKWHLDGLRGPGVPILADDPRGPAAFGFDEWVSVTNFFDLDPIMSRNGDFEPFSGTSSDIITREALRFMKSAASAKAPFLAVIWDGSPHVPFRAIEEDMAGFEGLEERDRHHYGELVAFDRSIGLLRQALRDLGIEKNTLIWYCSDNGGLAQVEPSSVGPLRGHKGTLWEGGIRVPAIIEWSGYIEPGITPFPASTMDIFPTIAALLNLADDVMTQPVDGKSLLPVLKSNPTSREHPIPFRFRGEGAWIAYPFKLIVRDSATSRAELFDLDKDPGETRDLSMKFPDRMQAMLQDYRKWETSVQASLKGSDYPGPFNADQEPVPVFWRGTEAYEPYLEEWKSRWEYKSHLRD